ncbi:HAD family hydrolase [Nocardia alba]|uniref:Phosphoglycolate phosphatase-like HAD superfamily hydrolase n=1 Tax=Nocardia alba TaxID=225051 RepID=A0A4R1FN34_9NOCA|nr:HAD hydrolase-like protein [Nocardia alba]TCJ95580.1 phosphoglycolate phosphatase-like HAD superfamily hydrolase [Nocardia alba]
MTAAPRQLVLWDLDYTLLDPAGFGQHAIRSAFSELTGFSPPAGVLVAGRTDRAVIAEFIAATDPALADRQDDVQELAAKIAERRRHELRSRGGRALPGAAAAVEALAAHGDVVQSVLTGNLETIGRIKVGELGLGRHLDLTIAAFGDAHTVRSSLVQTARARARERYGVHYEGHATVIIGDTPHDVEAAAAQGAFSIGVGTGQYSVEELSAVGADSVVPHLKDPEALLAALP